LRLLQLPGKFVLYKGAEEYWRIVNSLPVQN
jgi:hypothetical protein